MVVDFLLAVEVFGKWPTMAKCIILSLQPRTEDSARPIALPATQIQWWMWGRADIMNDWRRETSVECDAPTGKTGEATYTVWEAMLELDTYEAEADPKDPGAVSMLIDLQKAFEKLLLVRSIGTGERRFNPQFCRCVCCMGISRNQRRVVFEGSAAAPVQTCTAT